MEERPERKPEIKAKKKMSKTKKIILIVVGVILLVLVGVALRYLLAYNGFLDKITNWGPEKKQYSVIVTDDSEAKGYGDLKNKGVGFLKTDTTAVKAEQYLQAQVKVDAGFYDDVEILTDILENRIVEAIVLETNRFEMMEEEDLAKDMRVIETFEIELDETETEVSDKEVTKEPFILYISGSDSRTGIRTTARSDVNILAVVNPEKGKILLVSIPRDTYVQLHDTTGIRDKLTHAGVYGINMSKATIEDFLGIKIDHTLKVSFETVVKVVDELGGIEINSDQAMSLRAEGKDKICEYIVGKQEVDGDCALRFARERKSYETGDRHRGENQQQVITAIIGKLSGSRDYLLKIPTILDIAGDSFETTLERDDIAEYIRMQLLKEIDWKVESVAVDGTGTYEPTYSMGANLPLYVMIPSPESVTSVTNKINTYLEN